MADESELMSLSGGGRSRTPPKAKAKASMGKASGAKASAGKASAGKASAGKASAGKAKTVEKPTGPGTGKKRGPYKKRAPKVEEPPAVPFVSAFLRALGVRTA